LGADRIGHEEASRIAQAEPAAPAAAFPTQRKPIAKLVIATSIGNALEWYDIAIYGYFAVYISKAFFPNSDPTISLLLTFGTFGLSFITRPLGVSS
jgi:MFS transporter, MHS family, proline/betaine transporter